MIVQCPHCSDRYRVNEQNIPSTGGRIRCPSCSSTFVVYPTSAQQQQPAAAPSYDAEKTSVATNISDLMGSLGGGFGGQQGGAPQQDEGATEVISGDSLPNFAGGLFGGGGGADQPEEDGTVEMENPLMLAGIGNFNQQQQQQGGGGEDIYGATEIVSADEAAAMLGDVPGNDRTEIVDPSTVSLGEEEGRTEIVDPAQVDFGGPVPQNPGFGGGAPSFGGAQHGSGGYQATQQPAGGNGFGGGPPSHAPTPEQAPPAAASGPDPNHNGPWKLKTNFGLTYEFPDTKGLKGWMASRDDFDGYTLSAGDDDFHPLDAFPQVSGGLPAGGSPVAAPPVNNGMGAGGFGGQAGGQTNNFGGQAGGMGQGGFGQQNQGGFGAQDGGQQGPMRTNRPKHNTMPPQPVNLTNNELPSRDAKWNKVLWLLFIVLFVGCSLLAVQIMGVYDFKALLGLSKPAEVKVDPPANTTGDDTAPADTSVGGEEEGGEEESKDAPALTAEQQAEVEGLVEEAKAEIKGNKLASAKTKLEIAKSIDPNRFDVYDLLAQVYEQTGEDDKAKAMRMEVQALRAKSDAGTPPE